MGKTRKVSNYGKALAEGLEQLHDYVAGKNVDVEVSLVEIEATEVALLRRNLGLSQKKFADVIGVSVDTLQNWEQGRRSPSGPARALLSLIARHPDILDAA